MASTGRDHNEILKSSIEKNLCDLCDCVKSLKTEFDDTQIPIDDDNVTFHRLCEKLEYLIYAGMRERSGVFSRSRSPWHYINSCFSKLKNIHDGIRFVMGLTELKTPKGKLRSFLRFCLVHQCLADTLQQCTLCEIVTSEYYSANSLFSKQAWRTNFIASLYELNDIQYDLAPTGYDLDVGWPTFARKQFGSFNWSRQQSSSRLSVSLLSNSESQSVNSYRSEFTSPLSAGPLNSTMTSSIQSSSPPQDPLEIGRLITTIRQLTEEKEDLQSQLDSLSQQLEQEKENGKKIQEQAEEERRLSEEKSTDLSHRLEIAQKQELDTEQILQERDRQLAVLKEELQAIKFDLATRQLEKERENQAFQQQQEQLKSALDQLAANEQLIGSLQLQLSTLTGRNQEERQSLDTQFRQMELSLMTRNEECEGLVNEIRSTVADMDQLRTSHIELQEQFKSLHEAESKARTDNQQLREESLMLRDKIVQLIKEKDCLWQRSDRLLHLQRIQATDQWLADGSIRDCQSCQARFTIFVRRHHCRLCGRIFCHACSDYWLKIASSARPTRTCHECYAIHRQFSQPGASGQLSELPITDPPESKDLLTEPVVVQQQQIGDTAEPCAGFSVISDDEIVQSLNDSSPYSSPRNGAINKNNIRTASLRSFESLIQQAANDDSPSEAFVSAGMIYRVPFQVERPGCILQWKFRTDPKSIAFAVVGAEDEKDDDSLTRIIVETALYKSEEDFIEGQAELTLAGRYYVYFDNSYSRFSANKVTFHLNLTSPSLPV